MGYLIVLAAAVGFGTAITAIVCGLAQGHVIRGAVESVARQPEAGGKILVTMIIGLALIESLTIYVLILGFSLLGKLPDTQEVLKVISGG